MPVLDKVESSISQHMNESVDPLGIATESKHSSMNQQQHQQHQHQQAQQQAQEAQQQLQIQQQHQIQQQQIQQQHQNQQTQHEQLVHPHHHHHHHHSDSQNSLAANDVSVPMFNELDLKSKDSKYKRWSPRMDQYLMKLLSDVVHSFPKGVESKMSKKAWAYVTGRLRAANPETVYSTYTKYSCQQHLMHVNHHRYKIWYSLMTHQKHHPSNSGYTYRWNPNIGKFQIFEQTSGILIDDDRQIKSLLYSEGLSLPPLNNLNKGNLIVNEFFFTDNLKYMSLYHNEILPLLMRLNPFYYQGLEHVYEEIPRFDYPEQNNEYFKALIPAKNSRSKGSVSPSLSNGSKKRSHSDIGLKHQVAVSGPSASDVQMFLTQENGTDRANDLAAPDDTVDPLLKRSRNTPDASVNQVADFENALASAAIAAIDSPAVTNGRDPPVYFKERKWFNKLMALYNSDLISSDEVLTVCEGVRDGKIPMFMLNVLDNTYYAVRNGEPQDLDNDDLPDAEIVKRIRQFMLPMTFPS